MEEKLEREKRKNNIIIVNMKESTKTDLRERKENDRAAAKTLLEKLVPLEDCDIGEPTRLGKEGGNRPRMLRVTLKSEEQILKKAPEVNKNLKSNDKKIYINSDFTPKQREQNKILRAEMKRRTEEGEEDLTIRHGKIVVWKKLNTYKKDNPSEKASTENN